MKNSTSRCSSQNGIDFRKAFDILAKRVAADDDQQLNSENQPIIHHANRNVPEGARRLGQVIDLYPNDIDSAENGTGSLSAANIERTKQEIEASRSRRREELLLKISSLSVHESLQLLIGTQQQRVTTYRIYDRDLEVVLSTRNLTHYPVIIANATASFSVLSDTINMIGHHFKSVHRSDLHQLILNLQKHEASKLNLTAALHLEQIRLQTVTVDPSAESEIGTPTDETQTSGVNSEDQHARTRRLLEDGVHFLQGKVTACVEEINQVMEELQCAILDEQE